MIVPITQEGETVYGPGVGGTSESTQLMALADLQSTGRLPLQTAEPAPRSHKSEQQQLKGKVA
jgi:hypothetical protein